MKVVCLIEEWHSGKQMLIAVTNEFNRVALQILSGLPAEKDGISLHISTKPTLLEQHGYKLAMDVFLSTCAGCSSKRSMLNPH